jgi:imidazolonepropionase-like amidohydrolase
MALAMDRGVFVTPTLVTLATICGRGYGPATAADARFEPWLAPAAKMMLTMAGGSFPLGASAVVDYDQAVTSLAPLHRVGMPILAGTDAGTLGVAHGASLHRELELLVTAELTPVEALRAATSAPADCFGLTDRGRIRPGRIADLVLVEGNPTTDITATANILGVWRRGDLVERREQKSS